MALHGTSIRNVSAIFPSLYLLSLYLTNTFPAEVSSGATGKLSDNTFPVYIDILTEQTKTQCSIVCKNFLTNAFTDTQDTER